MMDTMPGTGAPRYTRVTDLAPDVSAEEFMRDLLRESQGDSASAMLVVDETSVGPKVWLNAGISDTFAMLQWVDGTGYHVPSPRHNPDRTGWIHFRHPTGVVVPLSAEMRAPVDLMYQAVDEVIATRAKPACVEWVLSRQRRH
jgi:hypothetical protein